VWPTSAAACFQVLVSATGLVSSCFFFFFFFFFFSCHHQVLTLGKKTPVDITLLLDLRALHVCT
jgi:hypothetical protein